MERERLECDREPERRPRGRPRSEQAHEAILEAALEIAREVGYDALTMDAVAARAGVGKATLYRRWSSKELLMAEAVERIMRSFSAPDTGSLKRDLYALMVSHLGMYRDPQGVTMLSSLVAAMARSTPIAQAVREGFVGARRALLRQVLERALVRGELRRRLDVELVIDLLSGPVFYRFLVTGDPVEEQYTRRLVDTVLKGIASSSD